MAISVDLTIPNLVFLGVLVFGLKKLYKIFQQWRLDKMLERWTDASKDKLIVHKIMYNCTVMPTLSHFALKLETYLRMAKIPYEVDTNDQFGPKGMEPWISYKGHHMDDTHLIIQFLNKKFSIDLNKKATETELAKARACRVILEEHFFWGIVQNRAMDPNSTVFDIIKIPQILKYIFPIKAREIKGRMDSHGIGKHTQEEIYQMTEDDLRTVSSILGDKKFLGGDEPIEDDCALFGIVAQTVWGMPSSPFERLVHGELKNLKEYCERMKERYWPDWDSLLEKP